MKRTKPTRPDRQPLDQRALARTAGGTPYDTHELADVSLTFDKIVHQRKD
jgi:hypothetical protein